MFSGIGADLRAANDVVEGDIGMLADEGVEIEVGVGGNLGFFFHVVSSLI